MDCGTSPRSLLQIILESLVKKDNKNISSMLICRIYRDTGDTWAGTIVAQSPILLEVDFHIPMDTQGSTSHSQK